MKKIFLSCLVWLCLVLPSTLLATPYDQYNPTADKVLQPDGSIVSITTGTVWAAANEARAAQYKRAPISAAKYLLPDGSVINGVPINTAISGTPSTGDCIIVGENDQLTYGACATGSGTGDVVGPASPTAGYLTKWGPSGKALVDGPKIGTFTDSKWCSFSTAGGLACTEDAPAGSGDVTGVGDCVSGACLDGTSDGGTYISLYDGDSNKTTLQASGTTSDLTFKLPAAALVEGDVLVGSATANAIGVITKGSANTFFGVNSGGTLGFHSQIQMSDDAAQFYSATASKGTRKLVQSSISDGILLTDTPVITGNVTWTNVSQAEGTYTRVFEEALNVFTVKQEFNATAGLQVGATGVLITSDDDGAITFTGASAGYDEDLTINLDDTENTAVVSSSTGLVKMSFTGISLDATVPIYSSTDATITVTGNAGIYFNGDDDAIAFNLPADPSGKTFCFRNLYAKAITVNPDDSDYIQLGATKAAQGEAVVSTGAADELICLVGLDTSNWVSMCKAGTWEGGRK